MTFASPTDPGAFTVFNTKKRAQALMEAGDFETASAVLEGVMKLAPRDPDLVLMLGISLARNSRTAQAIRRLKLALDLRPNHLPTIGMLCECHQSLGEIGKAHKLADKVRELQPNGDAWVLIKARLFQTRGRAEEGAELIRSEIARGNLTARSAAMLGTLCVHTRNHEEGIKAITDALETDAEINHESRRDCYFTLGMLYDAMGDYDAAFTTIKRGNDMLDEVEPENYDKFKKIWNAERIEELREHASDTERPLFIVGMPRSGTTLTEQILLAHPGVEGVGESTALKECVRVFTKAEFAPDEVPAVSKSYLRLTAEPVTPQTERVLDKMPGNFAFLGVIASAMPQSTIIHCRRDARDTVLSCFFQNFGTRLPYSRRLETCAEQYVHYRELMEHWREVLDLDIHESVYEELVADPEEKSRALVAHTGLPWDDACLKYRERKTTVTTASIAQVRRPIYKSSRERWRRYEKHLGPALEILKDY